LLGRLGPNRFIALAEQSGDIESLGQFVTEKALQDLNSWEGKGPVPLRMHINISAAQLFASSSTENLKRALGCLPSPGGMVELEITETTLLSPESVETKNLLNLIKGKVHLCLDDFGTGYSALGYLTYLPFSTLKLDKSFVDNLEDPRTGPIVNWIISLAHTLGARVVAEGIETPEQFGWLADHNCDEAQGFLFSRSLSKEGVDFLLTRERRKEKLWSPR
jgi:EAL domain-containing protein (putative c-di-GMP-specific phosphodiesterase class I)